MARLNLNPTKMNLSLLKKRLSISQRGHKLLKDKQDELMRRFIENIKKNKVLREEVEKDLIVSFKEFTDISSIMGSKLLKESLAIPTQEIKVDIKKENIMSINIPKMKFNIEKLTKDGNPYSYGFVQTTGGLDEVINNLNNIMNKLLELAQVEKASQLMADELEKTRRRVNALEYKTIPDLKETIKYISSKLDENERANISRLMKVKDIISK